jgi:hypothetical protein
VGVEAGIGLSTNKNSVFNIPNALPVIGGQWGITIMFVLDILYPILVWSMKRRKKADGEKEKRKKEKEEVRVEAGICLSANNNSVFNIPNAIPIICNILFVSSKK